MWSLFLEAFSRGHFATLAGRTTRREFWSFAFFYLLISFVLNALSFYAATSLQGTLFAILQGISFVWSLGTVLPVICITVRRFRDAGVSPWWVGVLLALQFVVQIWIKYALAQWEVIVAMLIALLTMIAWFWILLRPSQAYFTH